MYGHALAACCCATLLISQGVSARFIGPFEGKDLVWEDSVRSTALVESKGGERRLKGKFLQITGMQPMVNLADVSSY